MKNLKINEEEKKEMMSAPSALDQPSYPYGLKLHICDDTFKKLELKDAPKVGEVFMIIGKAVVQDVHMEQEFDEQKEYSFSLQLTDMDIKKEEQKKDPSTVLYGE